MRMSRFITLIIAAGVSAITVGAVGAVANVQHSHRHPQAHASAATHYAVLHTARAATEAVPAGLANGISQTTVAKAHQLRTQLSHGRAWLAPTDQGGICLIIEMGATGCQDDPIRAAQGTVEALGGAGGGPDFKDGEVLVYGVVPDGVRTVRLYLKSGESQILQVMGNAFSGDVMGPTDYVEYTDGSGALRQIPAPSYTG